jgi:hypothetical protein
MKKILTLLSLLVCTLTYAQEQKKQSSFKNFVKEKHVNYTDFGIFLSKSYQIDTYGTGYGQTVKANTAFTLQTYNGFKVYKNLAIGATVGVDWFSNYQVVPISLGIRVSSGDTKLKKVKTFAGMDAGYGFMWLNDKNSDKDVIKGGLTLSPTVGFLIPTGGNANFTFSVGYKRNLFNITKVSGSQEYPYITQTDYELNRMAVRLGVNF